jgi:hypothetical protein
VTLTVPRSLDDVIAAIRARDAAAPRREAWDPVRWDTALADEVERLRALVARHPRLTDLGEPVAWLDATPPATEAP